jgi:hypothetical protein
VTLGQSTTHAERVGLLELFRSVDRDGDGGVDERELAIFMQRLLHVLAEKRAHERGDNDDDDDNNNSDNDEEKEHGTQERVPDLNDGGGVRATRRASISKQQQQHHHSFTDEEFTDFFAGIPKADPHFLSVDEFSQWWHSVIVGAPSAAGANADDAAAASNPIHVIAFERKAPLWMQGAEAVIYVFVCALLQPFLTAVVTAPFPVLTMPFCCASWLRKLAVAVSAPVAAAAPAAPADAAESKTAPAGSGNGKKSDKSQQQAAAAAASSPTTVTTATSFRRGESLVNKLRVLSGSPAASAGNVFGGGSGNNAASFRQSPAAAATPTNGSGDTKSPTFDAPAAKKEDDGNGGSAPPPQSGGPRRVTHVFQRRAAWNTSNGASNSNAASAAAINPLVFQADQAQDDATAQEVSVEDIAH